MRVVGNIFRDIGSKVRPAFGRLGDRVVNRGEQHLAHQIDDELPDLSEDDGEGDLGGGEGQLNAPGGRLGGGEGSLGGRRRRSRIPPPTRGEVIDAAQGMVDALAGLPMTEGVEAALSGIGELMADVAGYGTDPLDPAAFAAYQRRRRAMESRGGIHANARRLARRLRAEDEDEDEGEGVEGYMGFSEEDRWGSRFDADQFNARRQDQFFDEVDQFTPPGFVSLGNIQDQWGPGLWDDADQFDGDEEDQFGSGYERDEYGYGRNRGFVGDLRINNYGYGAGHFVGDLTRREILDGNVDDFDESASEYVDGYGDDCDEPDVGPDVAGLVSIGNIYG